MSSQLRKKLNKYDFEKIYLDDQPELNNTVKSFLENLSMNYLDAYAKNGVTEIDCRHRDGFSPNSNNHGGFDRTWNTTWGIISGCGADLCDHFTTEEAYSERLKALEDFKYDHAEKIKDIDLEKLNYHDLYEMNKGDLAEEMDEYVSSWINTDAIEFGFRAMYEGQTGSWHTLVIYACASDNRYGGAFSGTDIETVEIKFRNKKELEKKLAAAKPKLEAVFG